MRAHHLGGAVVTLLAVAGCSASGQPAPAPAPAEPSATTTATLVASPAPVRIGPGPANVVPLGRRGVPRGGVQHPNTHDPVAVATAVAVTVWSWDTALDYSPQDAARRAAGWMTPSLGSRTRSARTAGGDASWLSLSAAHGWTTATAAPFAPTQTRGATSTVTLLVTITAHPSSAVSHSLMVLTLTQAPVVARPPTTGASATPSAASTRPPAPTWQVSSMRFMPSA